MELYSPKVYSNDNNFGKDSIQQLLGIYYRLINLNLGTDDDLHIAINERPEDDHPAIGETLLVFCMAFAYSPLWIKSIPFS